MATGLRVAIVCWGMLRGEGCERRCLVSVPEGMSRSVPTNHLRRLAVVHGPTDNFPDGDYEVILRQGTLRFLKLNGKYLGIPHSRGKYSRR